MWHLVFTLNTTRQQTRIANMKKGAEAPFFFKHSSLSRCIHNLSDQ